MMDFAGKIVLITGGTRGIGRSIADEFLKRGAKVIITGRSRESGEKVSAKFDFIELDLLSDDSIDRFYEEVKQLGSLDVLINNAGINIIEDIEALSRENWEKVIKVNLTGPMLVVKACLELLKKSTAGKILNISSIWGVISKEKRDSYTAAKTGLIGFTRTLALDLSKYNILVNALCPGFTDTDLTRASLSSEQRKAIESDVPLGRFADVKEIANVALFLCSDLNSYITGQAIVADGGFTIK